MKKARRCDPKQKCQEEKAWTQVLPVGRRLHSVPSPPTPLPRGLLPGVLPVRPSVVPPPYHDHAMAVETCWGGVGASHPNPLPSQVHPPPDTRPAMPTSSWGMPTGQHSSPVRLEGDCFLQDLLPGGPDSPIDELPSGEKGGGHTAPVEVPPCSPWGLGGLPASWSVRSVDAAEGHSARPASAVGPPVAQKAPTGSAGTPAPSVGTSSSSSMGGSSSCLPACRQS